MKPINNFHPNVQTLHSSSEHPQSGYIDPVGVLTARYKYLDGHEVMISVWRVTWRDLFRMLFTRELYLVVMGRTWPPLFVETDRDYTGIDLVE